MPSERYFKQKNQNELYFGEPKANLEEPQEEEIPNDDGTGDLVDRLVEEENALKHKKLMERFEKIEEERNEDNPHYGH